MEFSQWSPLALLMYAPSVIGAPSAAGGCLLSSTPFYELQPCWPPGRSDPVQFRGVNPTELCLGFFSPLGPEIYVKAANCGHCKTQLAGFQSPGGALLCWLISSVLSTIVLCILFISSLLQVRELVLFCVPSFLRI
jgi:hypothetical protein